LRLSVDTVRDDRFSHMIVDYRSGAIIRADPIRDRENLADTRNYSLAMPAAKVPLVTAVQDAEMASGGYRAVRIVPILIAGVALIAVITLIKGDDVEEVSVKLD
jgi:hypothetical protein